MAVGPQQLQVMVELLTQLSLELGHIPWAQTALDQGVAGWVEPVEALLTDGGCVHRAAMRPNTTIMKARSHQTPINTNQGLFLCGFG